MFTIDDQCCFSEVCTRLNLNSISKSKESLHNIFDCKIKVLCSRHLSDLSSPILLSKRKISATLVYVRIFILYIFYQQWLGNFIPSILQQCCHITHLLAVTRLHRVVFTYTCKVTVGCSYFLWSLCFLVVSHSFNACTPSSDFETVFQREWNDKSQRGLCSCVLLK